MKPDITPGVGARNPEASQLAAGRGELDRALNEADPATLPLVFAQLTGERGWLAEARTHIAGPMSYQESMPESMRAAIRRALCETLIDYAVNARPWPPLPQGELLIDPLNTAAASAVRDDYVEMMREDLDPTYSPARELARPSAGAIALPATLI